MLIMMSRTCAVLLVLIVNGYQCFPCPSVCKCTGSTLDCDLWDTDGVLTQPLPNGTDHLLLTNWGCVTLEWPQVRYLELFNTIYYCHTRPILQMDALISLKIHTTDFYHYFNILNDQAKFGLKELHFLGIKNLSFVETTALLDGEDRYRELEVLVIDHVSSNNDDPVLDIHSQFFDTLSSKPELRRLELTHLSLNDIDILATKCPPKLSHLSFKGSIIQKLQTYYGVEELQVCPSLRTLDVSQTIFRSVSQSYFKLLSYLNNVYYTGENLKINLFKYFFNVENVIIDSFFTTPLAIPGGVTLDLSSLSTRFKRVYVTNNKIKYLNGSCIFNNESGIETYDLSHNILEYVDPRFIQPASFLKTFILASNKLHVMQTEHPDDFADLVHTYVNLETLDMCDNELEAIPVHMFTHNPRLVRLHLGHNKLASIHFNLSENVHLEYLGLNANNILITGFESLKPLTSLRLLKIKTPRVYDKDVKFDLTGSYFECSCDNVDFQKWMTQNRGLFDVQSAESYLCAFNGREYNVLTDEMTGVWDNCNQRHMVRVALIGTGTGLVLVSVASLVVFGIRRQFKRRKQLRKLLRYLQCEELTMQYLLFLSHCSADDELVLNYVLPTLSQTIRTVTKAKRDYICNGDKHFRPGHTIIEEVMKCVEQSAVVLLVLSNQYIKSPWCDMEAKEAVTQQKPVILILTETIDESDMSPVLKQIFNRFTRFKCFKNDNGQHEVTPTWETLVLSLLDLASLQINV